MWRKKMKYRVEYNIFEEVEADNRKEAIEEALKQLCNVECFVHNDISEHIVNNADVYQLEEEAE